MTQSQNPEQSHSLHTGGGAAITGDVHTGGGDFVGRDFIQHIREHVAITGDDNIVGDSNTVIRQEGGDDAIQIGQLNVTLSLEDPRRILDPRYGHKSGRRDFYTHAPRLEAERYVNRPHEYDQIKTLLLSDVPTVGITTALRGAGGFGKTTLARVLCDDAEVQARFSDGILWATLGENPDVLARLREWVTALGGIISENAPTIPQLVNRLTDLLRDGAYLLLIDDVWDSAALAPFLCGGPRCAHLATTRNRATLPANVQAVAVDTMRPAEAVALLGYGVAADTPESAALQTLAQRLGHWPLLLGIINGVLREMRAQGASLADALAHVTEGLAEEGLTVFDAADATDRARAVRATMEVSLRRLSDADRARYAELAIFPKDADIPAAAAARLWGQTGGLSAFKTKDLFRRLGSASLVQTYNAEHQTVRLHDVVRVYLAGALGPGGCAAAHRALLDAYRPSPPPRPLGEGRGEGATPWHTAPDDGYLYAHLAYHLDALAATDDSAAVELAALFATDDWLQVRVAADDYTYDGYLADLEYAWRRAEETARSQIAEGAPPDEMAECVRYALIRTTVNSLAGNYPPELIVCAVETGLWSPMRALSMAAKIVHAEQRCRVYTLLLEQADLDEKQRKAVQTYGLAAAHEIGDKEEQAKALVTLASQLDGAELTELLMTTQKIKGEWLLANISAMQTSQLIRTLGSDWAIACVIEQNKYLPKFLASFPGLADIEPEGKLMAWLIGMICGSKDEWERANLLMVLSPKLSGVWLKIGLTIAKEIKNEDGRAWALMSLIPQLTGELLQEFLAAVCTIESEWNRAIVLTQLAPKLKDEALVAGLAAARGITRERWRTHVLAALAPQMSVVEREQVLLEAVAIVHGISPEFIQVELLIIWLFGNSPGKTTTCRG